MLRKKLLARLGLLVVGFVTGAVVSIALLQNVLRDLDIMKSDAEALVDGVQSLRQSFHALELQIVPTPPADQPAPPAPNSSELFAILNRLSIHEVMHEPRGQGAPILARIREQLPQFLSARAHTPPDLNLQAQATSLGTAIDELGAIARRHIAAEQTAVSQRLRLLIVGLTIAALVITNFAIFLLVRTANMILRPVDELMAGSRELAAEHFDHRIRIAQKDEFDELAHAYNALADQLAANEQRKVKALQQLAVTLNHELNNVLNVIELQLSLLNRRSGGDPVFTSHLSGIHGNLARVAKTIASLRNVRRVVLTDYLPGEPMLDLPRCIEPDEQSPPSPAVPVNPRGTTTPAP